MAATYQGLRRGEPECDCMGCRMLRDRPESWMDCPPDRQAEVVLGLWAQAPSAIVRLVEELGGEHGER